MKTEYDKTGIRKVLVIQLRAIGDVVLTTPVFSILRSHFPGAEIHFLTGAQMMGILADHPDIHQVIPFRENRSTLVNTLGLLYRIWSERYDIIIDYQCTPGTALITRVSGAGFRLGWKMKRRQWAYNLYSTANAAQDYVAYQKCRALEELGIEEIKNNVSIKIDASDRKKAQQYLRQKGMTKSDLLINITPKGKRPARQWLPERVAALSDLLIEHYGAQIFYNWAPGEEDYAKYVADLCRYPVHILPAWPLAVFSAFLSEVDLHLSYDNGPKHLAIAAGTATVTLFATDAPVVWNPLNNPNHSYIFADVPCRSCRLKECILMVCMKSISARDVLHEIEKIPAIQSKLKRLRKI